MMNEKDNILPCFIRTKPNLEGEEWRDCLGYDGIYSVSNLGRIKSEQRYDCRGRLIKERILKQTICSKGTPSVKFSVNGVACTKEPIGLVGESFLGEKKDNEVYCHKNKNPLDNRLKNIIITTNSNSREISYKVGVQSDWGIGEQSRKVKEDREKEFDIYEDGILTRRICSCCFKDLEISCFYFHSNITGLRYECKDCSNRHRGVMDIGKHKNRIELAKAGLRYCSVCKVLKSLDKDFGKNVNQYLGKSNNCKSCVNQINARCRLKRKQSA